MRTLEDRLNRASNDARNSVAQVEARPVSALNRRIQQRRAFVGVAAFVLVVGLFGGTALLAGSDTGLSAASQGSPAQDATAVGGSADTTTTVVPDDSPSPETTGPGEWDIQRFGDEAHFSIQILADNPGEAAGTGYQRALAAVAATEKPLGQVNIDGGWTAEAFTFTFAEQNFDYTGYYFLWQHSDTVALEVVVYVDLFEEATVVVSSIEKFAEGEWAEILHAIGTATPGVAASTTTSIWSAEE